MFILSIFQLIFVAASMCIYLGKRTVRGKVHPITCHAGTVGSRCIAVLII